MRSSQVEIQNPCHESWDAMSGDGERRFCGVCQKHVHDLSAMRHDEARALLAERSGESLCVRYTAERDGSLRFRDLVPRASLTRKIVRTAFAAAMLAACTPHGDGPPIDNLGDAVIDSVRQDTVPTADGGCDYQSGPFTTVHLPPGHLLCKTSGQEVAQPPEEMMGKIAAPRPTMGEAPPVDMPPPPVDPEVGPRQEMGAAVAHFDPITPPTPLQAVPEPKPGDPFVPCDPKPGAAPPSAEEPHALMGDLPAPPSAVRPLMGKPTIKPPKDDVERKMGKLELPID